MRIVNPTAVLGENAACDYLRKKGYKIIERNFRKGYGEIDIIALDGKTLVFIEVKTRSTTAFGTPFEAIAYRKMQTLIKGAQFYRYILHPELPEDMRVDAIGVMIKESRVSSIEHLKDITQI